MFKVIGLDQREYGPIDAEVVRLWLSQGRLHSQSLIKREGDAQWQPVDRFPEFAALTPPPMPAGSAEPVSGLDAIVPYKNGPALAAYYLAVFSVIPCVGLVLGFAALWCGIVGLRRAREQPAAKGKVHAWIGIIVGGLFGLLYLILTIMVFGAAMRAGR